MNQLNARPFNGTRTLLFGHHGRYNCSPWFPPNTYWIGVNLKWMSFKKDVPKTTALKHSCCPPELWLTWSRRAAPFSSLHCFNEIPREITNLWFLMIVRCHEKCGGKNNSSQTSLDLIAMSLVVVNNGEVVVVVLEDHKSYASECEISLMVCSHPLCFLTKTWMEI